MRVSNLRMALPCRRSALQHAWMIPPPKRSLWHDPRVHPGNDSFPTIPITSRHTQRPQPGTRASVQFNFRQTVPRHRTEAGFPIQFVANWKSYCHLCTFSLKVFCTSVAVPEISFARQCEKRRTTRTCWLLVGLCCIDPCSAVASLVIRKHSLALGSW